jgi:hypothetical protein
MISIQPMKTGLLLYFLIIFSIVFSQSYPDSNSYCKLQPYFDYELCAHGIKATNGEIIVPPRYSEITLLPADLLVVSESEMYGVLNCELEVIIPIKYKRLFWLPKKEYAAHHGSNYFWLFETETGKGLMNSSLEEIIPPVNEDIRQVILERQTHEYEQWSPGQYEKTAVYFQAKKTGKSAIYHESGKIIVPQKFDVITCHTINSPATTPILPEGIFFHGKNDSIQQIYSDGGEMLLEENAKNKLFLYSLDSSTIIQTNFDDKTTQAFCLETGTSTTRSNNILSNNHFLLFEYREYLPFRVYGKHLQLIYEGTRWQYPANHFKIKNKSYLTLWDGNLLSLFSDHGEILLQTREGINIFGTESETGGCIWAVPMYPDGQDTLNIYSEEGELKQTYIINDIDATWHYHGTSRYVFSPLHFFQKGAKWGVFDQNGDLVIPFKLHQAGISFRDESSSFGMIAGYYVVQSGKMRIVNLSGEYLNTNKYDTIFNANIEPYLTNYSFYQSKLKPETFTTDDSYLCHFAIRKNRLFSFIEGNEHLCDSTFLPFEGDLLLIGHTLVNKKGKVVKEIKRGSIHKAKKFFLHIQENQAQVILFSGEKGLNIPDFKSAQVERNYVKVKLSNERVGAISLDGKRWLYQPKHYDITFTGFPPHHAWVKEDTLQTIYEYGRREIETYKGRWKLVDTSYKEVFPFPFSFPVDLFHYPKAIFESEGKIGSLDSSLSLVFPPEYEFIHLINNSNFSLLYNEGQWQLGHDSGDILQGDFDFFSHYQGLKNTSGVLSFNEGDTLIGLVRYNEEFEWVIPMTEINRLIANDTIYSLLTHIDSAQYKHVGIVDPNNRWRVQNNEFILNEVFKSFSFNQFQRNAAFMPDFEFNAPYSQYKQQQFYEEVENDYSKYITQSFNQPKELKSVGPINSVKASLHVQYHTNELLSIREYESYSYPQKFHNYVHVDSAQPVELSDILKKDKLTSMFLGRKYLDYLKETQSNGDYCPDFDRVEEYMWSNFFFYENGIYCSSIFITYEELYPYLTELGKRLSPW